MGRAGFSLLTVDVEDVKINYPSMWELMEDLRDMGESNAVLGRYVGCGLSWFSTDCVSCRRPYVKRDVLLAAEAIYKGNAFRYHARHAADHATYLAELHGLEDGTIPATFQIIFLVRTWLFSYNELISIQLCRQIGWKPSPNQPKPLPRGSGQTNLKDVL